jgi:hypothetical protein
VNIHCSACHDCLLRRRADGKLVIRGKLMLVDKRKLVTVCRGCGNEVDVTHPVLFEIGAVASHNGVDIVNGVSVR